MSFWSIFHEATLLNQVILLILFFLSILSWAVVIERWRYFATAKKADRNFFRALGDNLTSESLRKASQSAPKSPARQVFTAAGKSVRGLERRGAEIWNEALEIERDSLRETGERGLPLLAIVASASPFIGLLGTVWGVMIAFLRLGDLQGQPALELVGPGIAEALIATAAGLFAAIPATIAYNAFAAAQRSLLRRNAEFCRRVLLVVGGGRSGS